MSDSLPSKRIFIGGLTENVSEHELVERFSHFGKVSAVSLKTRVDATGSPLNSFAHLNLQADETSFKKCFSTYQNAKWKGSVMKLQFAKESVLDRLQREREETSSQIDEGPKSGCEVSHPVEILTTAKGVPGTPVPGKKDWVVGKYGRAVPIMKLKKSYKIPMVKHDPSKYCHSAKIFKDGAQDLVVENLCEQLTWKIDKPDSEITKKRKGEFPNNGSPPKKRPTLKCDRISQRTNGSPFSNELRLKETVSNVASKERDELEIVKIDAVFKKPSESYLNNSSNKFDSDCDSETESTLSSVAVKTKYNKPKGLNQQGSASAHHSEKPLWPAGVNGFSEAGIPEFKGLSMLGEFRNGSQTAPESSKTKLLSAKQRQVPSSEADVLKPVVVRKSGVQYMSVTTPAHRKAVSHDSVRESSIVADPVHDVTVKSPSLFSNAGGNNSKFITSTPLIPPSQDAQNPGPAEDTQDTQCKLIPEFKGLGMLSNLKAKVAQKAISLTSRSHEPENLTSAKDSGMSRKLLSSDIRIDHTDRKKNFKTHRETPKSSDYPSSPSILELFSPLKADSQKSKAPAGEPVKFDDSCDSDSTAGTDEIITRHKEKKLLGSSEAKKALSPNQIQKNNELGHPSKSSSQKKVAVVNSLFLSEFASGEAELEEAPAARGISVDQGSDHNSHDSDLDDNDFALVVKKLRLREKHFKQETSDMLKVKEKKKKKEVKTGVKEAEKGDKQDVSSLQSRLIGIAGLQEGSKPSLSSAEADGEGKTRKKQKHESLSNKEKHQEANQKRLEAVKLQAQQRQQQQQLLQEALRNVDSSGKNTKRIVFESSDDESVDEAEKETSSDKMKAANHFNSLDTQVEQKQEKPGVSLFSSSDDDDESDDEDYDEMFRSKPQFEGKKGEKLLKMENRFGDKRFKMDAKFADTDSDEENEAGEDKEPAETEASKKSDSELTSKLKEEQSASLKILENVVGKTTLDRFSEKISRNTKKIIDMNTVRFDPTKMNLAAMSTPVLEKQEKLGASVTKTKQQQSNKSSEASDLTANSKLAKLDSEPKMMKKSVMEDPSDKRNKPHKEEEVSLDCQSKRSEKESAEERSEESTGKKTSVEVSSTLVDLFKPASQQSNGIGSAFSLSQQFVSADSDEEDERESLKDKPVLSFGKGKTVNTKTAVTYNVDETVDEALDEIGGRKEDSSSVTTKMPSFSESDLSSDEGEEESGNPICSAPSSGVKNRKGIDEEMLNAGRVDIRFTKEQWHEQWDTLRQTIIKIYKKKHKDALKKKRVHGEQKRKKEFLKHSREAGKKNRGFFKKR